MTYLKLFTTHDEYENYKNSGAEMPLVSHCIKEIELHYLERIQIPLSLSVDDINFGDDEVCTLNGPSDVNIPIQIYLDGEFYGDAYLTDGITTLIFPNPSIGTHTISVVFAGDSKYLPSTSHSEFEVNLN